MVRVYKRNPQAKREKVTVPMSTDLFEWLKAYATRLNLPPTTVARDLIVRGLEKEAKP
jgi:hypothetical protein